MKLLRTLALSAIAALSMSANAEFEEGVHYTVIENPVRTSSRAIEVTEFFWYGCGGCLSFEPYFQRFKAGAADDVRVNKSPAMWGGAMREHAKLYYALEALRATDAQHLQVFQAIAAQRRPLAQIDDMVDFVGDLGLDENRFRGLITSFPVDSQVRMADARQRQAGVSSTPQVMVAGKYIVGTRETRLTYDQIFAVTEYLIQLEREARQQ